jgi:hypothetical protein
MSNKLSVDSAAVEGRVPSRVCWCCSRPGLSLLILLILSSSVASASTAWLSGLSSPSPPSPPSPPAWRLRFAVGRRARAFPDPPPRAARHASNIRAQPKLPCDEQPDDETQGGQENRAHGPRRRAGHGAQGIGPPGWAAQGLHLGGSNAQPNSTFSGRVRGQRTAGTTHQSFLYRL